MNNADFLTRTGAPVQKKLFVLIACEESQAECLAFRELGHEAFSCDIQKCRKGGFPGWHIQEDVTRFLSGDTSFVTMDGTTHKVPQWDLIIAHPPCTYLCKVGAIWFKRDKTRYKKMLLARDFFFKCLAAKAKYVAVENPLPLAIAKLPKPSAYACPSWFGVKYTKKTLYWLKNLPPIFASIDYPGAKCYVKHSRGKYRSRTFLPLARALAKQWSEFILDDMNK